VFLAKDVPFGGLHNIRLHLGDQTIRKFYIYIRRLNDINVQACTCDSLYRNITKFSFFAVLERWLIYNCKTECSFVYLMIHNSDITPLCKDRLQQNVIKDNNILTALRPFCLRDYSDSKRLTGLQTFIYLQNLCVTKNSNVNSRQQGTGDPFCTYTHIQLLSTSLSISILTSIKYQTILNTSLQLSSVDI